VRKWAPTSWQAGAATASLGATVGAMVESLGQADFASQLLQQLHPRLPAASWSVYRVGQHCTPQLYLSASLGIPDTTQDCWRAYLSGPVRADRSLRFDAPPAQRTQLCHIVANEVEGEHRARVYEAHGVAERVSIVEHAGGDGLFALNFYRHAHQRPLSDAQIGDFEQLAPALLALTRKQLALRQPPPAPSAGPDAQRQRLQQLHAGLTARELDVCERLLLGMTHDGIAADLALSLPTVKTYRNRAFARLGIHFRNELFALVLSPGHSAG
jgi:DNA-binding CsgD family transcriptional regulator